MSGDLFESSVISYGSQKETVQQALFFNCTAGATFHFVVVTFMFNEIKENPLKTDATPNDTTVKTTEKTTKKTTKKTIKIKSYLILF